SLGSLAESQDRDSLPGSEGCEYHVCPDGQPDDFAVARFNLAVRRSRGSWPLRVAGTWFCAHHIHIVDGSSPVEGARVFATRGRVMLDRIDPWNATDNSEHLDGPCLVVWHPWSQRTLLSSARDGAHAHRTVALRSAYGT